MKNMLLVLLLAICLVGWRADELINVLGLVKSATATAPATADRSVESLLLKPGETSQRGMSIEELEKLSRSDPNAYRKFLASYQVEERSAADKLMNYFARGKYE